MKESTPLVSIVISVFRNIGFLEVTLRSISEQSYPNIELVIIDDGNSQTDFQDLTNCLKKFKYKHLVVRNESNIGLTRSLIKGCLAASGKYICRIDNGDIMVPRDRVTLQVNAINEQGYVLTGGTIEVIEMYTGRRYRSRRAKSCEGEKGVQIEKIQIPHVTVMFEKAAYFRAGGYDKDLPVGQDTDLWLRMASQGKHFIFDRVFAIAPMWKDSISVRKNDKQIRGKIERLKTEYAYQSNPLARFRIILQILIEIFKLQIPSTLRSQLKHRKNYICLGRVPLQGDGELGLEEVYQYYEDAVSGVIN